MLHGYLLSLLFLLRLLLPSSILLQKPLPQPALPLPACLLASEPPPARRLLTLAGHLLLLGVVTSLWSWNSNPSKGLVLGLSTELLLLLSEAVVLRRAKLWWNVFLE